MKIIGKIIYALWAIVIVFALSFYGISCYIGAKVEPIVRSSIESMGEDFAEYNEMIEDFNYLRLWHEMPNNASFDRINMQEAEDTQNYSITHPYVLIKDNDNGMFSFRKVGYIYNNETVAKDGTKTNLVAQENSKVVLSIRYTDGLDFVIEDVYYDNDFNEYGVSRFHGLPLLIILIINAIARNIRYFDYCVKKRKKKNTFRLLQPYIFSVLIAVSFFTNTFPLMLLIGVAEEIIFTFIFTIKKRCLK